MKGTRPLNNDEIRRVSAVFTGTFEVRNRGLFMIDVSTGGRLSELLSLRVGDVYQNGHPVTDLLFDSSIVKGRVNRSRITQPIQRELSALYALPARFRLFFLLSLEKMV